MLVHAVVLVGVVVVLPLALGSPMRWWCAGVAVAVSFAVTVGPWSALVASLWLAMAIGSLVWADSLPDLVARSYAVVAAGAFVVSRAGLELFGIGEPIVELTAVHFSYAGVGAVTLAAAVLGHRSGAAALILTALAPPVVALGFVLAHPLPQVGGAVMMTVGVLLTATLQLGDATSADTPRRRWLLVSGLAPWVPMVLAVSWAASNHWAVPALSIPDMARTHGVMNVVFVVAGLWARQSPAERHVPVTAGPAMEVTS